MCTYNMQITVTYRIVFSCDFLQLAMLPWYSLSLPSTGSSHINYSCRCGHPISLVWSLCSDPCRLLLTMVSGEGIRRMWPPLSHDLDQAGRRLSTHPLPLESGFFLPSQPPAALPRAQPQVMQCWAPLDGVLDQTELRPPDKPWRFGGRVKDLLISSPPNTSLVRKTRCFSNPPPTSLEPSAYFFFFFFF